jgi:excisionase family DNA binding protein
MGTLDSLIERLSLPPAPETLSVSMKTAARLIEVSERTMKRMVADGRVRSHRVRGRRLVSYASLKNLIS